MKKLRRYEASERRAIAARLLVCLVPAGVLLGGGGIASASAAAPKVPKLVVTNPTSTPEATATSVTPRVLGEAEPDEEIITDAFPGEGGWWTAAAADPTKHPNFEILIYSGASCPGAPIATGTAAELEEGGIEVTVPANARTSLTARQVNTEEGGLSGCSGALNYYEGTFAGEAGTGNPGGGTPEGGGSSAGGSENGGTAAGGTQGGTASGGGTPGVGNGTVVAGKPDAPRIHTEPGGRSNNTSPLISGNASGAGSVSLFANASCNGTPIASGTPAQLSQGFKVLVTPNALTEFSAMAFGSQHSSCSTPVAYTEDSLPPRTRITMGPGTKTRKRTVTFRFQDITEDPPGTSFRCKVDKKAWQPCASPFKAKHLKPGHHLLSIRATDLAGNVEPKPVKRKFIVVRQASR
jgi:hypothetical protein